MLNRRILRIKAFKVIYAYALNRQKSLADVLAELDASCESTRDLYLFMLGIVSPLTAAAKSRLEAAKNKFNPSAEELAPNLKFAENSLASLLEGDRDFSKMLSKKGLDWSRFDVFIGHVLDSVRSKDYFLKYMEEPVSSLAGDCALFSKIFEEEFVDNEELEAILEDMSILWIDDLAYALTFCCRTMDDLAHGGSWTLPLLYQSDMLKKKNPAADVDSDRNFVRKLVTGAYSGYDKFFGMVSEAVRGWDSDRLFSTDITLMILGLAEAQNFAEIPLKVTMNEYVEISKFYSSPKSRSFVNGLLDKLIKDMEADGQISKSGAGLK